ncbi:MAG TPA: hypothetical protein DCG06_14450 [Deltaproteobacteria bacterium]|nr:hypothetical protein [Deltaproteobacteria bacterium]
MAAMPATTVIMVIMANPLVQAPDWRPPMQKITNRLSLVAILAAGIAPAWTCDSAMGQNLSDRIRAVAKQREAEASKDSSQAALLGALIYTDISVDFDETPAREAFDYLRQVLGVDLVVRYNDDRSGMGIDPEAPITLKATDKPALTIVEMMLDQCGDLDPCTWQLRRGFIELGTKERLSAPAARKLRMYPIRDLLFEVPMFDNAPEFDLSSSLQSGGGGGGGGVRSASVSLSLVPLVAAAASVCFGARLRKPSK